MEGSSEGNHATFWMDDPERSCQPLGMYSVIRVNPIFFDDDYGNSSLRGLPQNVARAYGATPPESPGKSGSSGYESNACSEEACRWDEETRGSSRRSFEPRTSRRQSNTLARTKRDARGEDPHQHHHHGEDEESSPSRAVLAPIPEGKVGGLPLLTATPIPTFLRTCSNPEVDVEVRRKPGSIPEVHERSEGKRKEDQESIRPSRGNGKRRRTRFGAERERRAPSSYPGNASGKKLLKKAEEIIRWGNNRTESDREDCKRIHTAAKGKGAVTGEDSDRTKARILRSSPSSSAASSVSSGFTVPPLRKTLLGPREDEQNKWRQKDVEVISEKSQRRSKSGGGGGPGAAAKVSQESPAEETKKTASQDDQNSAQRDVETSTRGTIRGLSAVDVCEKLKALDLDARSSLGAVDKDGGDYGKPGWDNYGDGSGGTSPFTRKCKECSTVFHVSKAYPLITNNGPFGDHLHLDFTLDVPRAERLLLQIAAAKRRRCCIRLAGAAFALVFFLISVVVVSMLYSRGKRVFGPL